MDRRYNELKGQGWGGGGGGGGRGVLQADKDWGLNFWWLGAAGVSEPLLHYSLFCGQL